MRRGWLLGAVMLGTSLLMLTTLNVFADPAATNIGSEACKDCHQKEYAQYLTTSHGRAETDGATLPEKMECETCHGPGSLHAGAAGDTKDPGYSTIVKPDKLPADKASALCQGCHKAGDQFYWAHSAHARKGVSCVTCHSIHGSKDAGHARLLKTETTTALCITCHKSNHFALGKSSHMPVTEGDMTCADCHNPHGSAGPKMIRALTNNELCGSCHADKRGPFLWEHAPVRENCLTCHEVHGSNNDKVLAAKRPYLCQRCHIGTRHPSTLYDMPDLASSNATRSLNRGCVNCHSQIHGSNHPSGKYFTR